MLAKKIIYKTIYKFGLKEYLVQAIRKLSIQAD